MYICIYSDSTPGQGKGFMKESVDGDNVNEFSRPWFSWANGLFGQLIIDIAKHRPHLIF